MSKGTPFISLRMNRDTLAVIEEAIDNYNATQVWRKRLTRTEFIIRACREKLDHWRRGRKSKRKRKAAA